MQIRIVVFGSWKKIFAKMQLLWKGKKCSELKMIDMGVQLFYSFPNTGDPRIVRISNSVIFTIARLTFWSQSSQFFSEISALE